MSQVPSVKFSSGHSMPIIGLGTEKGAKNEITSAVHAALELGYRHIDTAFMYENETAIGEALEPWLSGGRLKRNELFITTKLPMIANNPYKVKEFLQMSLNNLKLDYVDLYLIHFPVGFVGEDYGELFPKKSDGDLKIDNANYPLSVWKAMENEVEAGRIKSIGLSNFNSYQIDRIIEHAEIQPANLQVEVNLYFQQGKLRSFCDKRGVAVTAYAPLGSLGREQRCAESSENPKVEPPNMLDDTVVKSIAESHSKTPAQVLLRHLVQQNVAVIPGSTDNKEIAENFDIFNFELTDDEMNRLNGLDKDLRTFYFDEFPGIREHRDYPFNLPF